MHIQSMRPSIHIDASLKAAITQGQTDEEIFTACGILTSFVASYKEDAKVAKKHTAKPKPKAKAAV